MILCELWHLCCVQKNTTTITTTACITLNVSNHHYDELKKRTKPEVQIDPFFRHAKSTSKLSLCCTSSVFLRFFGIQSNTVNIGYFPTGTYRCETYTCPHQCN